MYNPVIRTSPSFSDHLDNQAASKWSAKSIGTASCIFSKGAYHLRLAPGDFYITCPAAGTNYHNFIYQVQMTIINGLDAGITFRSTNVTLPLFLFTITTTGLYSLYALQPGRILAFGRSSAINTGLKQTNLLTVMAQGSAISLFINKQFVKQRLSAHAYPREIEFVDALPKTPSGKIQRFILRQQETEKSKMPHGET